MPNNRGARRLRAIAAVFLLLLGPSAHAGKKEAAKETLEQLQSRIEALKKDLDSTQEAHTEAADALKQSELAISEANRKLYELNQQHRENRGTLQSLQQEKTGLEHTIQEQQRLLGEQLYRQYLNDQQGYLQIVLTQHDPAAMARELHYLTYVARARSRLIESLRKNLGQVAVLNEKTAATLREISDLKTQQESLRKELQSQQKERKTVLSKLSEQIKTQRGEISKLQRDEKRLTDLVKRLSRLAPAPAKKSLPADRQAPGRNEVLPSATLDGGSFAALKGKLRLPVRGEIANRFGESREDSNLSWKGLFIKASEGSEVKSVASGRVVFADWLRGFGNLLIVDHGDGFMSLYGNNQALLKKVGDEVRAGDTLAAVGNSGGNAEAGLYFELRHQSKPLDPLSWSNLK